MMVNKFIKYNYFRNFSKKGQKIILPDARPKDIIGHWSFDDGKVIN